MAGPLGNLAGLGNLGNLNNLGLSSFGNNMGMKSLTQNVAGFENITKLDDFLVSPNGTDQQNISEQLQGVITKIQSGQGLQETDLAHLSDSEKEMAQDLKSLIGKNKGFGSFSNEHGAKDVADNFSNLLGKYVNNVNQSHKTAEKAIETFATGGNIDLHTVMTAAEKANLSMQLTIQLRNKVVQAYQEINRIHV